MYGITNAENLRQNKMRISWTVEQILAFASSPNIKKSVSTFQTNCMAMF